MTQKTIIFDLDGTLLDTLEDLADAVNYALRKYGLRERPLDEIRQFVGNGVRRLVLRSVHEPFSSDGGKSWIPDIVLSYPDGLFHPQFEDIFSCFKAYYVTHCQVKTRLYEGMPELLGILKKRGYRMAIVSNKLQAGVTELRDAYFSEFMEVAIGEQAGISRKPAPDTVFEAIRQLDSTIEDSIYVGDSEVDIETARNAGVPCISALWGFRDESFLTAHGAKHLARRPLDLLTFLD